MLAEWGARDGRELRAGAAAPGAGRSSHRSRGPGASHRPRAGARIRRVDPASPDPDVPMPPRPPDSGHEHAPLGPRSPPVRHRRIARTAIFLAAAGLTLAPWTLRNHAATGRWNPGTFFGPYNLWAGMNDRVLAMYHGAGTPRYTAEVEALFREDSRAMVREMEARGIVGPVAEGRYWSDAARDLGARAPGTRGGDPAPAGGPLFPGDARSKRDVADRGVAALSLWPVHLLALLALWWRRRRMPWLLLAPPLAGLLASLPFVFSLRYRFPFLDPYAVLFAAAAVTELPEHFRRSWRMRTRARPRDRMQNRPRSVRAVQFRSGA